MTPRPLDEFFIRMDSPVRLAENLRAEADRHCVQAFVLNKVIRVDDD